MASRSLLRQVGVPTAVAAGAGTIVSVVVNIATDWKTNPWAWVVVAVATALSALASFWLYRRQAAGEATQSRPDAGAPPDHSQINVIGSGSTGYIVQSGSQHIYHGDGPDGGAARRRGDGSG